MIKKKQNFESFLLQDFVWMEYVIDNYLYI